MSETTTDLVTLDKSEFKKTMDLSEIVSPEILKDKSISPVDKLALQLQAWEKEAEAYKSLDKTDKVGIKAAKSFRIARKNNRIALVNAVKDHLEPIKTYVASVTEDMKGFVDGFKKIEDPIFAEEKRIVEELKADKAAAALAEAEKIAARHKQIADYGIQTEGTDYVVGDEVLFVGAIKNASDEKWDAFVAPAKKAYEKAQKALEKERKAAEEKAAKDAADLEEFRKNNAGSSALSSVSKSVDNSKGSPATDMSYKDQLLKFAKAIGSLECPSGDGDDMKKLESTVNAKVFDFSVELIDYIESELS